jgi:O-antigen/teichoic acid export membrane protein
MNSVGVYNVSANLFYRLNFIGDAVATAIFPAIAQLYFKNKSEASNILTKSLSCILIISIPISVGGLMLADDIIVLIYGDGYASSSDVFRVLISAVPFSFLTMQLYCALGAIKLQGTLLRVTLLLLTTNFIVNILIVPIYGIVGAACAKLITECIGFITLLIISLKYFNISETLRSVKIIILPICAMALMVYYTSSFGAINAIFAGAFSFIVVLYFFGKDELSSWATVLKKNN